MSDCIGTRVKAEHATGDLLELARGIDMQWKAQ
jgi:hypothetical protein